MGGTPKGNVSCHDLSGPMPPKGRKEKFGVKYVALRKNILVNKDQTQGSQELCFFNICNSNVSQPLKSFTN